jgi:hypothetical protein
VDISDKYFAIVSSSITVTSPKSEDTWQTGKKYNIKWKSANISKITSIKLETASLSDFSDATAIPILTDGTTNPTSFSWTVPLKTVFLKYNRIIILGRPTDASADDVIGTSETFNITVVETHKACSSTQKKCISLLGAGTDGCTTDDDCLATTHKACNINNKCIVITGVGQDICSKDADCLPPVIKVISPNGNEEWKAGSTHAIRWTSANLPAGSKVTISLENVSTGASTPLFTDTDNDGSENWTISSDAAVIPLGNYRIKISSGAVQDYSNNNFSIVSPSAVTQEDMINSLAAALSNIANLLARLLAGF